MVSRVLYHVGFKSLYHLLNDEEIDVSRVSQLISHSARILYSYCVFWHVCVVDILKRLNLEYYLGKLYGHLMNCEGYLYWVIMLSLCSKLNKLYSKIEVFCSDVWLASSFV